MKIECAFVLFVRAFFVISLCFAPIELAMAESVFVPKRSVPEDQFLALLLNGKYEDLDRKLQILHKAYMADRNKENDAHKVFYMFYRADPRIGRALNAWLSKSPTSALPYLARGIYRTKIGWEKRGYKWASDTNESQFSGMASWFKAAKEDLERAASIDPSLVESYCFLIEIDMTEGGRRTRSLFNQALKVNPYSFIAREYFLHSQLPRWGGSHEAMQEVMVNTKSYYKDAPRLKVLEGSVDAELGELALSRKDYSAANKYLDAALVNGDFWFYNKNKGKVLWRIGDYRGAIDQFSRVIRDKPGDKEAWWLRAHIYKTLRQFPDALADINYAIEIEPQDDLPIAARGYIFEALGDFDSAVRDFKAAAVLDPTNPAHQQAIMNIQQLLSNRKTSY